MIVAIRHPDREMFMARMCPALLVLSLSASPALGGEIYRIDSSAGLNRAMGAARPGDRILLAPGDYESNFYFRNVHGKPREPIIITAANAAKPPRFIGKDAPLHFSGASYLELRNLVFTGSRGNALNIDDDGKPEQPSHHITLQNIHIHAIGPKGNVDGIKLTGVDDFLVIGCTIERWGSSGSAIDMVGCHRGIVQRCTFRKGGENAVQAKGGSSEITIRKCHFEDAGDRAVNIGGLTANTSFRPPLESMPAGGKYEAREIVIEGCTFVRGEAAIAFVNVDGAVARYNTIYLPEKYAIRILQERADPQFLASRNGLFENNIVVFRSSKWADGGINIGPGTAPKTFRFRGNLWYCEDQPGRSEPKLPVMETDGVVGKDPQLVDPAASDFAARDDGPAKGRGAHALPAPAEGK
jgi:hypothetical protein